MDAVHRYEGYVVQALGDGILALFGAPLAMRLGINTGEVVVRSIRKDDFHTDYVPVGHTRSRRGRRERLAAVYDGFTEGFDTPDLQAARALLDAL